jgi:hypothetical protein
MAELSTDVHIFLSSTFLDLKELRKKSLTAFGMSSERTSW